MYQESCCIYMQVLNVPFNYMQTVRYMFYLLMLMLMCFRLADLAMEFELERPPTVDDLLTVIINREDVEALIGRPVSQLVLASKQKSQKGYTSVHSVTHFITSFCLFYQGRRFKGPRGKDLAATRIQSSWRMFKDRSEYLEYRRRKWASGVIAISWIMHVKMSKVKVKLKVSREEHLENFRRRARVSFCENQSTCTDKDYILN